MQKTLSVRISEKVTAFLEHTKATLERSGEKASTSDVARKMLDAIVEQQLPAGFVVNKAETLQEILRAQRDDLPLSLHQYAFLADQAHTAYQKTKRDFVRADLLLNNLDAFEAVVKLRDRYNAQAGDVGRDHYFLTNLGARAQEAAGLVNGIECGRTLIKELGIPFRSTAEYMTRNLEVILRDGLNVPEDLLDESLRPHLRGLLLLALKAYLTENNAPLTHIDNRQDSFDRIRICAALTHRNEAFKLTFVDGIEELSVYLTPLNEAWSLSCSYQRFADLAQLIQLNRNASSEYFVLRRLIDTEKFHISANESEVDIGLTFTESEFIKLREIINMVTSNDEYKRVFSLLDLKYGSI